MESSVVAIAVPPDPVSALPAVQLREGSVVKGGASLLGTNVHSVAEHVAVATGFHQVDLARRGPCTVDVMGGHEPDS